ncbi:MAG TPA: VanZ family protein [Rhodocyclaceae bacterium]|jgi:VanZ family protein|nr:VanZ family protein [Betaproteobacteria bacterium]HMU99802.1 VanZ family protein [Rhodocyclaceae bacterium]HNL21223.1 VanZ family protein [Rhodocyclaceae bacterium]HNM21869.1 VanZ family protein [Rhodocyclaceae bacterium]HNM80788.1 VanZ family protein [Rhodocyclaceae bacterium]
MNPGPDRLARYLALAWCGLIVYASLHPFSGWRDTGASPLAFLDAGWPRYWTVFDLSVNVAVYLPLGFLITLGLSRLPGRYTGAVLATLFAAALSFTLESIQTWLPSRVPSNLDLACNAVGGLLGTLFGLWSGPRFFARVGRWQQGVLAPRPHAEQGLTLLGLWLMIPLSPEILLFGAGDLRQFLGLPGAVPFAAPSFILIEAAVTACNLVAVGLLAALLAARTSRAFGFAAAVLALGLVVRTLAAAILVGPGEALAWATPGAQLGLLAGILILAGTLPLPTLGRQMVAAMALMAATVLVNLAPPNPYSAAALATWQQGHFLNFNGLTRLVSTLWPFLTLPFLLVAGRRS